MLPSLFALPGGGLFKFPRLCFLAGGSRDVSLVEDEVAAAAATAGGRFLFRVDLRGCSELVSATGGAAAAAAAAAREVSIPAATCADPGTRLGRILRLPTSAAAAALKFACTLVVAGMEDKVTEGPAAGGSGDRDWFVWKRAADPRAA